LKLGIPVVAAVILGRSLHGERGLKPDGHVVGWIVDPSLPSRGAWIETRGGNSWCGVGGCRSLHGERGLKLHPPWWISETIQSLPSRGAWIETRSRIIADGVMGSLPSRGAWIETSIHEPCRVREVVAPFTGSVD